MGHLMKYLNPCLNDESAGSVMNQAVVREESFDNKLIKIKNEKVQSKALEEGLPGKKSVKPPRNMLGTFFTFFQTD